MHLNSNDLFTQIGLVVDSEPRPNKPYCVYLEIQLSEGKHQLLQIKNYDSPHAVATNFCKKHKLNQLAVQIVESKIIEAKRKEESKNSISSIRNTMSPSRKTNHSQNLERSSGKARSKAIQKEYTENEIIKQQRLKKREKQAESKSISRSKSRQAGGLSLKNKSSPQKKKNPRTHKQDHQNHRKKEVKESEHVNNLYNRALIKNKLHEQLRIKQQELRQRQEDKQLTFMPKINPISSKIVQFRRENYVPPHFEKENRKQKMNNNKGNNDEEEMRECTFKPQINAVSNIIASSNQSYKDQYDHFNTLYKQAEIKKKQKNNNIDKETSSLFKPKINCRSQAAIKDSFQQRLEKSLLLKQKREAEGLNSQYPFRPKVGRAPKDSRILKQKQSSISLWDQLYSQKLKKCQTTPLIEEEKRKFPASNASNIHYQNLRQKRISEVFQLLDEDEDGYISPDEICIQNLTRNQIFFLKPIFEEMQELDATLDYNQFKKALLILLSESSPAEKGSFLSEKRKNEEKIAFTPQINPKSKEILSRVRTNECIYDQLYEKGLRDIQRKQYEVQKERERQEQKELEGCSFKPQLNNTSKYYIQKVLGKRINQSFDDELDIF